MQAIITRFLPCTNTRPSRVKAIAEAGSVILSWDHALNSDGNHKAAAEALRRKFGWIEPVHGDLRMGWLPNNGGAVHVMPEL